MTYPRLTSRTTCVNCNTHDTFLLRCLLYEARHASTCRLYLASAIIRWAPLISDQPLCPFGLFGLGLMLSASRPGSSRHVAAGRVATGAVAALGRVVVLSRICDRRYAIRALCHLASAAAAAS